MSAKLTESPEISGLLYKKRGGFGKMMPNSWQYRFFILSKEGVLTYYDTDGPENKDVFEGKERGRLDLRGIKYDLVMEPTEGAPTPHLIIIQPEEGERWKLCADTKEDHARWWRLIEKFAPDSPDRVITRPGHLNVQSDDDYDPNVISPTNHSKIKRASQLATRTAEADSVHASVPSTPSSEHLHVRNTHTPIPSATAHSSKTSTKKKSGLRAAKDSGGVSQEWVEWVMVMAIVNICIYALVKHTLQLDQVIYIVVLNAIVAHTMTLRAGRASKSAQAAAVAQQQCADLHAHQPLHLHASPPPNFPPLTAPIAPSARDRSRSDSNNSLVPVAGTAGAGVLHSSSTDSGVLVPGGGKPMAGFTLQQVFTEPKLSPEHTWCKADYRQFNVRVGPDYNRHKKKAPSAVPIYEPFAVDVFCTKLRADHCSPRFQLLDPASKAPINVDTGHPFVPSVFVIQIQIPSDPPSGFFTSADDGPGWAIMMYYRITEDSLNQLKDLSTASPAIKLFAEWCEKCTEDPAWRGRFKVINSCTNLDEMGIPSAISSYNAKPILIRRTGSIFRGVNDGVKYMEMNIHVHKFATLAKQSIHYISSRCGQMFMQIGFVIEGREDTELPETMFACVAVNKPQEEKAEFIFDEDP
eukprot:gene15765-18016_t